MTKVVFSVEIANLFVHEIELPFAAVLLKQSIQLVVGHLSDNPKHVRSLANSLADWLRHLLSK